MKELTRTLGYQSSGKDVWQVQEWLGVPHNEDDLFDRKTGRAVKEFQQEHGLTVDGLVGRRETWPKLLEVFGTSEEPPVEDRPVDRSGSSVMFWFVAFVLAAGAMALFGLALG